MHLDGGRREARRGKRWGSCSLCLDLDFQQGEKM